MAKKSKLDEILKEIRDVEQSLPNAPDISPLKQDIDSVRGRLSDLSKSLQNAEQKIESELAKVPALIKEIKDDIDLLRRRLNNQTGGGNANRNIQIGGAEALRPYTDINLKAGTNVTITYVANNATKYTDVTITATGGGAGTVRSVNTIAIDTAAGSTAGTDYVYICTSALTLTLPATVGNSNLYTVKNTSTGIITIATTGGDTIDAQTSIQLSTQYTSVDLVSDGVSNWNIT